MLAAAAVCELGGGDGVCPAGGVREKHDTFGSVQVGAQRRTDLWVVGGDGANPGPSLAPVGWAIAWIAPADLTVAEAPRRLWEYQQTLNEVVSSGKIRVPAMVGAWASPTGDLVAGQPCRSTATQCAELKTRMAQADWSAAT